MIKGTKLYQNIARSAEIVKEFKINVFGVIFAALLSFLASVFDGISIALLIPVVKGLFEGNFLFTEQVPVLNLILRYLFSVFGQRQAITFSAILALIFTATIFKNVLKYGSSLLMSSISLDITHTLRRKIYARYLSFGKLFFDKSSYGYLYTVLMTFSQQVSQTLARMNSLLFFVASLVIYLIIMFFISWQITLFVFLIFPILHFSMSWLIKKIEKSSRSLAEANVTLTQKISNALASIPLVKAYTNEDREKEWVDFASRRVNGHKFSIEKKNGLIEPIHETVTMIMMFMVVGIMAVLLVKKETGDIAAYMTFFILLRRVSSCANIGNEIRRSFAETKGPIEAIKKIFDDNDKYYIKDGTKIMKGEGGDIKLDSLDFSYPGGVQALKDINVSIDKGKTVAIVGSSGSGKSTIINLIIRYYDASSGSLKIDGLDIREYTLESLRSHMALVSQDTHLFNAPLEVNLKYGSRKEIPENVFKEAVKLARLDDFIANLPDGLKTEIGERGIRLSGGEKQRVSICRAILKKANIVLLDEATSALDSITERQIQEALDNLTRETTTIVVAHRLSTIKHADKIIVVENGRLIEQGKLEELLDKKGAFYKYWQEQKFF